jgi:hypothetical protein
LYNRTAFRAGRDLTPAPRGGGRWKSVDNSITERRPDGSVFIRFQPTPAWRTPEAIDRLHGAFAEAEAQGVADPLILIAVYVLDFLCIHPFVSTATAAWRGS